MFITTPDPSARVTSARVTSARIPSARIPSARIPSAHLWPMLIALTWLTGCAIQDSEQSRRPGEPTSTETLVPPLVGTSGGGSGSDMGGGGFDLGGGGADMGCGAPAPGDSLSPFVPCVPYCDEVANLPPSFLILLDRSGSMAARDKWTKALDALYTVTYGLKDKALVGLAVFPEQGDGCGGQLLLSPAVAQGQDMEVVTQMIFPSGSTPLAAALGDSLRERWYLPLRDVDSSPRPKSVILITDGEATECQGDDGHQLVLGRVREHAQRGVRTYAVGFGYEGNALALEQIARAGGTKNAFMTSDADALIKAFGEIAQELGQCVPR